MSVPQLETKPNEAEARKETEVRQETEGAKKTVPPVSPRRRRAMPCWEDWDFWRFLLSALGLLWDIVKTTFLK